MKKQFVTYEIALKLKELGFDEECLGYYTINNKGLLYPYNKSKYINRKDFLCAAPLWQQVINWFIEEHNIDICLVCMGSEWHEYNLRQIEPFIVLSRPFAYQTYYKARKQAILKVIELIKNNNL